VNPTLRNLPLFPTRRSSDLGVADEAGIAEMGVATGVKGVEQRDQALLQLGRKAKAIAAADQGEDPAEFERRVIREFDEPVEAGTQAGIGIDEALHFPGITCDDHDQAVAIVLHPLEERVDRLPAVVLSLLGKAVGLINEEDAVKGR